MIYHVDINYIHRIRLYEEIDRQGLRDICVIPYK